jgi:hypothetical protein
MMHDCLVVSSDYRGRASNGVLVHGETCLVFPVGDMQAAAECIIAAMARPEVRQGLVARGHAVAESKRSLAASAANWHELLDALIHAPATAAPVGSPRRHSHGGGHLARLGLPDSVAEWLRRLAGRRFAHASAGEEWPPYHAGA